MDAALRVVDDLLARDSDGVFLRLDLQVVLVDTRQLNDREDLVALLKNVDGRERALPGGLVLKPLTAGARFKRSLKVKKRVERVSVCCDHDRTRVGGDMKNRNQSPICEHRFG